MDLFVGVAEIQDISGDDAGTAVPYELAAGRKRLAQPGPDGYCESPDGDNKAIGMRS